jgi:hypothetical protein
MVSNVDPLLISNQRTKSLFEVLTCLPIDLVDFYRLWRWMSLQEPWQLTK